MAAGTEHAQYLVTGYYGRYGVRSAGESFTQDQHIRLHILCVAGKETAGAAQPGLNFVRCKQNAFALADCRCIADKPVGRNQDARFTLNRLEKECTRVRSDGTLQCLGVTERNGDEARCEWPEAVLVKRLGGEAGNGGGAPVKVVLADDDFSLIQGNALAGVAPPAAGLDSRLHGFRTGVHRQDHLHAAHLREFGYKERKLIVAEGSRGERNPLGLFFERLDNPWMAVALVHR